MAMMPEREIPRRSRRRFLREMGVAGIGGVVSLVFLGPIVGYLFAVLMKHPSLQWVKVASLNEVDTMEPREYEVSFVGQNAGIPFQDVIGVFLIRRGDEILAFENVCAHMGCPVRWMPWRQQIICPCHAGTYDRWGQLMGGPPSESLPRFLTKLEGSDVYIANRIIRRGNLLEV